MGEKSQAVVVLVSALCDLPSSVRVGLAGKNYRQYMLPVHSQLVDSR